MNKHGSAPKKARRRVTFAFYAPRARELCLLGDFNQWDPGAHSMKKDADGVWHKTLYLIPGRYEYRFLVDGQWCCDPRNLNRCQNCFGSENNVLEVAARL